MSVVLSRTEPSSEHHHGVQFYHSDEGLCDSVATHLARALCVGEPAVVIATAPHRAGIAEQLRAQGFDVDDSIVSERITFLDADETLAKLVVDGMPSWQRFSTQIGAVLDRAEAQSGKRRIAAYGEMVDVLWRAGRTDAALQLEGMWCRLASERELDLLCAYCTSPFVTNPAQLTDVCEAHDCIGFVEHGLDARHATVRTIAQQVSRRKDVEAELRGTLAELRRSEEAARLRADRATLLQKATAQLAAETDLDTVVDTIVEVVTTLFDASAVGVYLFDRDGTLRLQAANGDASARLDDRVSPLPLDGRTPIADAIARRQPIWLDSYARAIELYPSIRDLRLPASALQSLVALPLLHHASTRMGTDPLLGGIAIAFAQRRELTSEERGCFESLAQQAALAIDRARLYVAELQARTEARKATEDQRRLVEDLTETLHLNELFTGVLAHDLRNPLGAITTAAQLLILRAERGQGGDDSKPAMRILASARRMARMIDQLLDFTRVRLGAGLPLSPKPCELRGVLGQVVDELRSARPEAAISVEHAGDTTGTWDDDRLSQVFSNLVANAVQHGERGHAVVVRLDGRDPETARVEVRNRGVIAEDVLARLFEPKLGTAQRRDGSSGLGLGLFITHEITKRHGGTIRMVSNATDGTMFEVTLPRHAPAEAPAPERPLRPGAMRSRERFLIDTIRDYAIFMLDTEGRIQTWNKGAEVTKGYRADEIIGRHISLFYTPEDRQRGAPRSLLRRAREQGHVEDEAWRVRKDGTHFWANVVMTALYDEDGVHTGFAKITRDLTERKKLEEERLRLAEANEGIRLRDEFLSIVSHELKTPLTGLQLQLDLLLENLAGSDDRVREQLRRADVSAARLTHLIDSLLDVSRIATGRFVLATESFDLVRLVDETIDTFRTVATRSGTPIELVAPQPVHGSWDRVRLMQVVTNLLSNALKYGIGKPIDVSIDPVGADVDLVVRDRGPGISVEDRERIFGRFERASNVRHFGGLGIGLYVVREIVNAHGGSVSASNATDGGAVFTVRLPREPSGGNGGR